MALRVALTGGGTGGHVFPVIAVAQAVKQYEPKAKFLWIGSGAGFEKEAAKKAEISFVSVPTGKVRRYFSLANIADFFKVPLGVIKAFFVLAAFRPHVLFSKGGYVSYPTVIAAWLHDIPILLHETDSVPGLANRKLSTKTTLIATSFPKVPPEFPKKKTVFTGQPIRKELLEGSAERAREKFKLTTDKPILVIFGGSQGAKRINQTVFKILPELLPHYQIIHQVGSKNIEEAKPYIDKYYAQGYRAQGFFVEEMADIYAVADIIVARSGGQVHEFAPLGKPLILLPLAKSASNHQVHNAYAFASVQAALSLQDANLTPTLLRSELLRLLHNNALRLRLGNTIKKYYRPMAAEKIVYWLLRLAKIR